MAKELDPSLFGEGAWTAPRTVEKPKTSFDAVSLAEQRISDLRVQHRDFKEEIQRWMASVEEFKSSSHNKFERLAQQVARLEGLQAKVHQEVTTRVSQIHSRLADRQTMDMKVQEMMDKHNAMIRSAEMRFAQIQKMLGEKEAQMLAAQMALNDARMEISRLKRM